MHRQEPWQPLTHSLTLTHGQTDFLLIHLSSNQAQFSSPLPPTTVTFTCHTDFIFTATTAHLPALSPDCQSAASRLHPLTIHHRPKAPDHNIRYKHRHQQPSDPAHDGRMLLLTNVFKVKELISGLYTLHFTEANDVSLKF